MIQNIQEWLLYKRGIRVTRQQIILSSIFICIACAAILIFAGRSMENKKNIAPNNFIPAEQGL